MRQTEPERMTSPYRFPRMRADKQEQNDDYRTEIGNGERGYKGELERKNTSLEQRGVHIHLSEGVDRTILGVIGDTSRMSEESLLANSLVEKVMRVQEPYKMANRLFHPDDTVISVGEAGFGPGRLAVIAGPCSVESEEQIISIARSVKASGATFLRGGAFKPRTSPYSFQGMGCEGIDLLLAAKRETGLPIVTE